MRKDRNQLDDQLSPKKSSQTNFCSCVRFCFHWFSFLETWLPLRVFSNWIFRSGLGFCFRAVEESKAKRRFVVAKALHQWQSFRNAAMNCSRRKLFFQGIDSGFLRGEVVLIPGDETKSCRFAFCFDGGFVGGRRKNQAIDGTGG